MTMSSMPGCCCCCCCCCSGGGGKAAPPVSPMPPSPWKSGSLKVDLKLCGMRALHGIIHDQTRKVQMMMRHGSTDARTHAHPLPSFLGDPQSSIGMRLRSCIELHLRSGCRGKHLPSWVSGQTPSLKGVGANTFSHGCRGKHLILRVSGQTSSLKGVGANILRVSGQTSSLKGVGADTFSQGSCKGCTSIRGRDTLRRRHKNTGQLPSSVLKNLNFAATSVPYSTYHLAQHGMDGERREEVYRTTRTNEYQWQLQVGVANNTIFRGTLALHLHTHTSTKPATAVVHM